jgi:hypothetical protein
MAEIIITVRRVPGDGRTSVAVGLVPADDLLPQEHEDLHRRLAGAVVPLAGATRDRPLIETVVG